MSGNKPSKFLNINVKIVGDVVYIWEGGTRTLVLRREDKLAGQRGNV